MFGFSKKRVLDRMENYHSKLTVMVYLLMKDKEFNGYISSMSDSEIKTFSAALTNFLFGRKTVAEHLDKFDYDKIKSTGYSLLDQDENLQEIIVQSLRVLSTLLSQQSSLLENEDGYEILEKYGKKFPDSPNPESYESLFIKANQWMPDSVLNKLNNG